MYYFLLFQELGDRHPKVGSNVLIGANASILGNVKLGDGAKIGAGSVVLKPIPHGATAVGVPGKVIGWAKEAKPGSDVDASLANVDYVTVNNSPSPSVEITPSKTQPDIQEETIKASSRNKLDCSLCPYQLISSNRINNDENFVTLQCLTEILRNEGASEDEIGEIFFELLHDSKELGCIPIREFKNKFATIAKKYTKIDSARLDCIAKGDCQKLFATKDYSFKVKKFMTSLVRSKSSIFKQNMDCTALPL